MPHVTASYDAFISYAHEQQDVAIWLHRLLERYWVPGRRGRTVFLDREHLSADVLAPMIQDALDRSRCLILLCSSAARDSKWVNLEIEHFISRHGGAKVFGARVGSAEDRALPEAIERQAVLAGKLVPELSGVVSNWDRKTRQERELAALALLGSILGVDKSQITARRQRAIWLYGIATAVVVAGLTSAVLAWNWWRKSTWIELDRSVLSSVGKDWTYELIHWDVAQNKKTIARSGALPNGSFRLDVPPGSYSLSLSGEYADESPRTLMWPLLLKGTYARTIQLRMPSPASFERAAHMAWISAGDQPVALGRDGELVDPPKPYWIDVFPVRAREVWGTSSDTKLRETNAVENALEQVPAGNLPELVDSMSDIMAYLDAETENQRGFDPEQFPSVMLRATKTPCDECPAPVSKDDAMSWCAQRGGRLPTLEEWQLAARGLDERLYPWGNRYERSFANIVGYPNEGETMALTPVDQFPQNVSPYGVWDTVGNSGEWVHDGDPSSSLQAGGGYWNDRDGATVYSDNPVTDAYPYEIGVRCVLEDSAG